MPALTGSPFFAFVARPGNLLSECVVFGPSEDNKRAERLALAGTQERLVVDGLEAFGDNTALEVLRTFCQEVHLWFPVSQGVQRLACGLAERLLKACDGQGGFARERLPYKIQGIQELDWSRQNELLAGYRERQKKFDLTIKVVHDTAPLPFFLDIPTGRRCLFLGLRHEEVIVIDDSMRALGLIKFLFHTFEIDEVYHELKTRCSWQVFVKFDHPDFCTAAVRESPTPVVCANLQSGRRIELSMLTLCVASLWYGSFPGIESLYRSESSF
jgi:hypothetical protein